MFSPSAPTYIRRICVRSTYGGRGRPTLFFTSELSKWSSFCAFASKTMVRLKELRIGYALSGIRLEARDVENFANVGNEWVRELLRFKELDLSKVEIIPCEEVASCSDAWTESILRPFNKKLERLLLRLESSEFQCSNVFYGSWR